jgi:hypothetical protein
MAIARWTLDPKTRTVPFIANRPVNPPTLHIGLFWLFSGKSVERGTAQILARCQKDTLAAALSKACTNKLIAADRQLIISQLKQSAVQLREKELRFYTGNFQVLCSFTDNSE